MKPKISDFPYYTNLTECDELVPAGVLFGDNDNTKIYTGDATEDLEETIKGVGLRTPIYVPEEYRNKTSKKIHSGHRREKTLKEMEMTHFPIKYVSVQKHDNPYDNIISLMTENQTRDRSAYQKYQSVVSLNDEYFKKEGVQPTKETITMHCALSTTNIVTFNNAEKIRTRNPELWKRVKSGKISLSGAVDKFNNKPKEKNRHMSPNTLSTVTTDRINRTLRLTQLMMTQYNNISVPDPLNPNEDWKPTKEFQKQTITADVHEAFTKSLARILVADGFEDAVALNKGFADLELNNNEIQMETKATIKKPRSLKTEWTGSNRVKGAYYNLIKFNSDFTLWFHAIVKVPYDKWISGGALKKLSDSSVNELIKNNEGVVHHGTIDNDGDVQLAPLV